MRRRNTSGHAVIETALMAPWIFLLFIAIFDFGFYAYAGITTANAARAAALYTSTSTGAATDTAGACQYVLDELRKLPNVGAGTVSCGTVPAQDVQVIACKSGGACGFTCTAAEGGATTACVRVIYQ